MRQFAISIDVPAPPDRVWQVMSDVERWHEWTPSVSKIKRWKSGSLAVGHRAMVYQPRFPPAMWKVTAIEPGRSFTWVSVAPGLRVVATHGVAAAGSGTRATLSLDYQGLFGGLMARLTRAITERYLALEANGLKARSEDPSYRHRGLA